MGDKIQQIKEVSELTVACDGGGGALGHPKVYLSLDAGGEAECPYCDCIYRLATEPRHRPATS